MRLLRKIRQWLQGLMDRFNEWLEPKCPRCGSHSYLVVNVDEDSCAVDYRCNECGCCWWED